MSTSPDDYVHRLFVSSAAANPDAVAISCAGTTYTYRQLDQWSDNIAAAIDALGIKDNSTVVVITPVSPRSVASLLGVLKAGAVYVPLDISHPISRLLNILVESQPLAIIVAQNDVRRIQEILSKAKIAPTLIDPDAVSFEAKTIPERFQWWKTEGGSEKLAYIIYTSGSTGQPKGVMIDHRNIAHHTKWFNRTFQLSSNDKVVQRTALTFDASIWEILSTLSVGAQLWMVDARDRKDPEAIRSLLRSGATVLQCTPTFLKVLLEWEIFDQTDSLRLLFCGGEALSCELAKRVRDHSSAVLVNLYGPTECTIDALYHVVCDIPYEGATIPIGRPIEGVSVHLENASGDRICGSDEGELIITGDCVGRGYMNNAALTAEVFLRSDTGGPSSYRTGDIVRRLDNDEFQFLRRDDQLVKIRGYRVDLSEVELALKSIAGISDCAVLIDTEHSEGASLVAIVTPNTGQDQIAADVLRLILKSILPDYMIPRSFFWLTTMPINSSGKIDRRALLSSIQDRQIYAPSAVGEPSEALKAIWSEVLGQSCVNPEDDFFANGGDSLLALILTHRIHKELEVEVLFFELMENPTFEEISKLVDIRRQPLTSIV